MSNQIRVIHPYWDQGQLVFDDASVGLVKEPFVANADNVLASLAVSVDPRCKDRFTILFSDEPFAGYQFEAVRLREEYGGNWYEIGGEEGWLCPALFKYFDAAPDRVFFQIKP
jgi:hypothetical protein